MNTNTAMPDGMSDTKSKEWLKSAHPDWNILYTDRKRWCGQLDPNRGRAILNKVEITFVEADKPQELHLLILEAESPLSTASS
ncbi:hypothetical protein [Actinomadura litoris]|uniref:hypothetical protein n=1 Tax=Actinomadura litoris TaxID=2678616 RepID=UPI001FA806AF|nr:hypothetical protein [Actinomadura litoris]